MARVTMYTTKVCGFCRQAKSLLGSYGVVPEEIRVDEDPAKREEMITRTDRRTVPQIFIGDRHIGGFEDLNALHKNDELQILLES